jgi:hypothetical protein
MMMQKEIYIPSIHSVSDIDRNRHVTLYVSLYLI